jgi:hypothetical protein
MLLAAANGFPSWDEIDPVEILWSPQDPYVARSPEGQ